MEITNIAKVKTRQEWREWLEANHATEKFCWVRAKRGMWGTGARDGEGVDYLDLVEEALCFGWIDSTSKSGYQRFSPRTKKSNWTQLNIARCERLKRLGFMTNAGRVVMPKIAFEVAPHVLTALQADPQVWQNYLLLPETYKRVRIDNIQSWYGYDNSTYEKRLKKFIDNTREGKLFGDWYDGGRLEHDFTIRYETPNDYGEIYTLTKDAFATVEYADGDEQDWVIKLRNSGNYIPQLALIVVKEDKIVGHIMLTKTIIKGSEQTPVLLLSPVSSHPNHRKKGIGASLIIKALSIARDLGYKAVFLCGDPNYYGKFGFKPVTTFGLTHMMKYEDQFVMGRELTKDALKDINGTIDIV
ncbi:MAG: GNAT family N-acetyltransferase [Firmicutes bacterium]|nr:GNAT family N-acetyltransferase [Bacillota bacterium]